MTVGYLSHNGDTPAHSHSRWRNYVLIGIPDVSETVFPRFQLNSLPTALTLTTQSQYVLSTVVSNANLNSATYLLYIQTFNSKLSTKATPYKLSSLLDNCNQQI